MNDFKESDRAFRGPFDKAFVKASTSTRQTPLDGLPPPVEIEIPISQLPLAGPLQGDEFVPIVQNGVTSRATTLGFTGPQGAQGPQGALGPQGAPGPPGVTVTIGLVPPPTPIPGQLWFDTAGAAMYVWYVEAEGTSSQWVPVVNQVSAGGSGGGGGGIPEAPLDGQLYGRENATWIVVTGGGGGVAAPSPINTALPHITGAVTVGSTLTCSQGSWANSPTAFTFQWESSGVPISGATASTYTIQPTDASEPITCVVTATNSGGFNTAISNTVIIAGAPANTVLPTITGTGTIKQTLTLSSNGTWLGVPTSYTYQWQRGGTDIVGATAGSYQLVYADGGQNVTCNVTAHNSFGATLAASNAIAVTAAFSFPVGALGIYSTRLAVAAYGTTSPCCTVRRLSDNTTADNGVDEFGGFDMASALGFAGGCMLAVTKWYDQSGSGNHATQVGGALESQPELLLINNQPYLAFCLTSAYCYLAAPTMPMSTTDQTIGGVFQLHTPYPSSAPLNCFDGTNGWFLDFNGGAKGSAGYFSSGGGAVTDSSNLLAGSIHSVGVTRTLAGAVAVRVNGTQTVTTTGASNAAPSGATSMCIGTIPGVVGYEGLIGEVYIYPSIQNVATIQASEATYFPPTGWQNYYNGAHAMLTPAGATCLFGNKLQYEYTQAWTMFAAIRGFSHLGEEAEAALWSNIYHGAPFIGYIVAVVLNTNNNPFPKGTINCRMVHDLTGPPIITATVCGSTDVVDGKPHLIAVSWDGSGLASGFKIYIDGVLETTTNIVFDNLGGQTIVSAAVGATAQNMAVGMQINDNGNQLKGRMEFLQVDQIVRSQAYITANFSAANPGPPPNDAKAVTGTALRLLFTEGSGTSVHDTGAIGTSLVGTLTSVGGSLWSP